MCWFSTEYANQIEDAKTGQRLGIKKMNWHSNWVVRETELDAPQPCPVCLIEIGPGSCFGSPKVSKRRSTSAPRPRPFSEC
jgi:hypothetical protein